MLALKGYEHSNGFSVMNTDELFFINGGCGMGAGSYGSVQNSSNWSQTIGSAMSNWGATMTNVGAVWQATTSSTPTPVDDVGMTIWNGIAAGLQLIGGLLQ